VPLAGLPSGWKPPLRHPASQRPATEEKLLAVSYQRLARDETNGARDLRRRIREKTALGGCQIPQSLGLHQNDFLCPLTPVPSRTPQRLDSPNPRPVIALQHDGINIPDEDGEKYGTQPGVLTPRIEPSHDSQANGKTAQVQEFIVPRAGFPFDRRTRIFNIPEARIEMPSEFIPVITFGGESLEPTDAQSFVESAVTFKVPQIQEA
jgi:hypothetical protein